MAGDVNSAANRAPAQGQHEQILNKDIEVLDMQKLSHLIGQPFSQVRAYVHEHYPKFRFPTQEEFEYLNAHLDKLPRGLQPLPRAEHQGEINIVTFDTKEGEDGESGEPMVKRLKLRSRPAGGYEHRTEEMAEKREAEARLSYDDVIILFKGD